MKPMAVLLAGVAVLSGCSTPVDPEGMAKALKRQAEVADATCVAGAEDRTVDCVITFVPQTWDIMRREPQMVKYRVSDDGQTVVPIR